MNRALIRNWLGLASDTWPPDHYSLLGLQQGEDDTTLIEQQARERMERIRWYQLLHPEEATEVMNRLAQALVCLTDAAAKEEYEARLTAPALAAASAEPLRTRDRKLPAAPPEPRTPDLPAPSSAPTTLDLDTFRTAALVQGPAESRPEADQNGDKGAVEPGLAEVKKPVPILLSAPADPVFETARSSLEATRGLGTKQALYNRLTLTRRLQRAWDRAGEYLSQAKKRVALPAEEANLVRHLRTIAELMQEFPAFLGRPGQPGQHVVTIASQSSPSATFKMLDVHQRTALARDWVAGRTLLAQHRQFLRHQLLAHRGRSRWSRISRAIRAALNDHPGYVMIGLLCTAIVILLFHWLTDPWQ